MDTGFVYGFTRDNVIEDVIYCAMELRFSQSLGVKGFRGLGFRG